MEFTCVPENYALLEQGLRYDIDFGEVRSSVDIAVRDLTANRTVATLRFADTAAVSLDIAPYVRRLFRPQPVVAGRTGCFGENRLVTVALEVDGVRSPMRTYTLLTVDGLARMLTTLPRRRTIAAGEFDEIPIYAPEGGMVYVDAEYASGVHSNRPFQVERSAAFALFRLAADDFSDAVTVRVTLEASGRTDEVVYEVVRRNAGSRRLAWVASSGEIAAYTFPTCCKERLKVDKVRFYAGEEGYRTTGISASRSCTLVSDYEPRAMIEALDEVLAAPRVWLVSGTTLSEVDVVSSECSHSFDGSLNSVAVEIRDRKREEVTL